MKIKTSMKNFCVPPGKKVDFDKWSRFVKPVYQSQKK
jgi:hypothetical protein